MFVLGFVYVEFIKDDTPTENINFDYTEEDQLNFLKKQNPANIWTMVYAEDSYVIIPGFHWVNRDSYFVTQKPVEKEDLSNEFLVI